jgi:hypothetical protein
MGESGTINHLTHESQTITLQNEYDNPVIFAQPLSYNGGDPSIVRLDNLSSNSFEAFIQETNHLVDAGKGEHTTESVSYFVFEAGTWELSDGTVLEVGTLNTDGQVTTGFDTVNFSTSFSETPAVFSQVQTNNGGDFVRTRQQNPTDSSFEVGMEEEEAKLNTHHVEESIGWLAMSPGQGNGDGLAFQAGMTGDEVTDAFTPINFSAGLTETPHFLSSLASYDGPNSAGLRYQNLTENGVEVKVEEDTSLDEEVVHTTETVNFLAMTGDSLLEATPIDPLTQEPLLVSDNV